MNYLRNSIETSLMLVSLRFCFDQYPEIIFFRLAGVYCPILILHDRKDEIISFELGKKVITRSCFANNCS